MSDEKPMGQVIQIDEARIRDHLGELVRGTVEETLNAMLDAEADQLCGAGRYELVCLSIQHGIQRLFHRATNQLAKMVPDTGFIDLDHLTHRLLVTHRLLLHCPEEAVNPESAERFCTLS